MFLHVNLQSSLMCSTRPDKCWLMKDHRFGGSPVGVINMGNLVKHAHLVISSSVGIKCLQRYEGMTFLSGLHINVSRYTSKTCFVVIGNYICFPPNFSTFWKFRLYWCQPVFWCRPLKTVLSCSWVAVGCDFMPEF